MHSRSAQDLIAHVAGANLRAVCLIVSCPQASRDGTDHVVSRQRPPDALQLELTDRLNRHGVLNLCQNPSADQDLSGLGLVAQTRGDIRNGSDGVIVCEAATSDDLLHAATLLTRAARLSALGHGQQRKRKRQVRLGLALPNRIVGMGYYFL